MSADLGPILKAAYPQVVATLVRVLGDMDRAMDATQDALVKALQRWQQDGVPDNPVAWLVTVGRNRAVDQLRRENRAVSLDSNVVALLPEPLIDVPDQSSWVSDVDDDLLRLMFTCCHPSLSASAQITLVLKVVLGFSVEEIARGLLASRASIDKRITRAKARLRAEGVAYEVPTAGEMPARLGAVLQAIYLLFNEGYTRIQDGQVAKARLIGEAIRLGRMTARLFRQYPEPRSLLALMLLSTARLPARLDDAGHFVPLLEQDRSRWDQSMIREGVALIDAVYAARHLPGAYQIQAAISAIHSGASSAADTDWQQIAALYDKLAEYDASPVVPVNHAVALCYCGNAEAAMARLENVAGALQDYQPYHAAAAHVHEQLGNRAAAIRALRRAVDLAGSPAEKHYLQRRLRTLETGLGTA